MPCRCPLVTISLHIRLGELLFTTHRHATDRVPSEGPDTDSTECATQGHYFGVEDMDNVRSQIIATEKELACLDPQLGPIPVMVLRDKLARLQEILNRKD
jgi:hypothetical protein